jgi:hypothetical protein
MRAPFTLVVSMNILMTESTEYKIKLLNPLTGIFVFSVILYSVFCVYWDGVSIRKNDFVGYLSILFYPISYPYEKILLYFHSLKEPDIGHRWDEEFFVCIFLATTILISFFISIFSANETYRKISIRVGIPLLLAWVSGVVYLLVANAMG